VWVIEVQVVWLTVFVWDGKPLDWGGDMIQLGLGIILEIPLEM